MNRAEESTIEGGLNCRWATFFKNALPCSLLHFVGGAMGKCDHDKLGQDLDGISGPGELDDALGDRVARSPKHVLLIADQRRMR